MREQSRRLSVFRSLKRHALSLMVMLLVASPASPQQDQDIQVLDRRAVELIRALKHAEASALAQQALELAEQRFGPEHASVAQRLDNLAFTLRIQRRYSEAEPLLKRALAMREALFGADSPDLCQSLSNHAVLYEMQDRLKEAQLPLARCLSLRERAYGVNDPAVGQSLHELSKLYKGLGRPDEAAALYDRALEILGPEHPAELMARIARGEDEQGRETFFGKVSDFRWTGLRVDRETNSPTMKILGEATHNNGIWHPFEVEMAPDASGRWKVRSILPVPLYWLALPPP